MPRRSPPDLSSLGADSCGVWTRTQAGRLLRPHQIRALLEDGVWQTLWPGVHCDAGRLPSTEQRAWAAVLASVGGNPGDPPPPAVASGLTAARCWGLPLIDDDDPCTGGEDHRIDEVAVLHHRTSLRHGGRVLRRRRPLPGPDQVTASSTGVPITTPLCTIVDLSRLLSPEALVCALDAALREALVSTSQLLETTTALRGRAGARLRLAVDRADGRSESPAETLARLVLLPVLPDLEPQFGLYDGGYAIARFDLADVARRLAIEADGKRGHSGSDMVAKDRRRDARTEACGWWTERVTWFELRRLAVQTQERVRRRAALLESRAGQGRPAG